MANDNDFSERSFHDLIQDNDLRSPKRNKYSHLHSHTHIHPYTSSSLTSSTSSSSSSSSTSYSSINPSNHIASLEIEESDKEKKRKRKKDRLNLVEKDNSIEQENERKEGNEEVEDNDKNTRNQYSIHQNPLIIPFFPSIHSNISTRLPSPSQTLIHPVLLPPSLPPSSIPLISHSSLVVQSPSPSHSPSPEDQSSAATRARFKRALDSENQKSGRFSKKEKEIITKAVYQYIQDRNLGDDGVEKLLNPSKHSGLKGAWTEISNNSSTQSKCLPQRSPSAIYMFGNHHFAQVKTGKWSPEEVRMLKDMVTVQGKKWRDIGKTLNRLPYTCRDKWRLVAGGGKTGRWSPEEDAKLIELVQQSHGMNSSTTNQSMLSTSTDGNTLPNAAVAKKDIMWTAISKVMAGRSHSQCRNRWFNHLLGRQMGTPTWSRDDEKEMVESLISQQCDDISEVQWSKVSSKWPGLNCQSQFVRIMKWVTGFEHKPFNEILQDLSSKYQSGEARTRRGRRLESDNGGGESNTHTNREEKSEDQSEEKQDDSQHQHYLQRQQHQPERVKGTQDDDQDDSNPLVPDKGFIHPLIPLFSTEEIGHRHSSTSVALIHHSRQAEDEEEEEGEEESDLH